MNIGDLVECIFLPKVSKYSNVSQSWEPMVHIIKGQFGIITKPKKGKYSYRCQVFFPELSYYHTLCSSALVNHKLE